MILSQENKKLLLNGVKSLAWRTAGFVGVGLLNLLAGNLGLFNLPTEAQLVLGLLAGEVTKFLNK